MTLPSLSGSSARHRSVLLATVVLAAACGDDSSPPARDAGPRPPEGGSFVCQMTGQQACEANVWVTCVRDGEFLRPEREDCSIDGRSCVEALGGCTACVPDSAACVDGNAARCTADGQGFEIVDECDIDNGEACRQGQCVNLCERALEERSYEGCEFWGVDLDNAAVAVGRDASAQQYSIMVSNPHPVPTEVVIEVNDAAPGERPRVREVARESVLPNDLEVFDLPRREVDGSTGVRLNDGTHSALTSNAFRVRSTLPVIAVQFNPLDNVGVFSNDASLLLPTSAIDTRYVVNSWPQTIADTDDPNTDFDPNRHDEDLRAFLTIVGTQDGTEVTITFGPNSKRIIGLEPDQIFSYRDVETFTLNEFDVLNLETDDFNADFTATRVEATRPVSVFAGSEASDAPWFDDLSTRQCCADHLEEQMMPTSTLGRSFVIARMPPRTVAINQAFVDPIRDSVPTLNEPEYVRIVAVAEGTTHVTTTLPAPDVEPPGGLCRGVERCDEFDLEQYDVVDIDARQDFLLDATNPVSVIQVSPSQEAVGLGDDEVSISYPGGDPAMIVVPPRDQWRDNYVFLTPDKYAFDFVIIMANATTQILLDGAPLSPIDCTVAAADGLRRLPGDPPPDVVIHRCQLTFPEVVGPPNVRIGQGDQSADGYHTLIADEPVGLMAYGFDAFVSYGYAAGLNLRIID